MLNYTYFKLYFWEDELLKCTISREEIAYIQNENFQHNEIILYGLSWNPFTHLIGIIMHKIGCEIPTK